MSYKKMLKRLVEKKQKYSDLFEYSIKKRTVNNIEKKSKTKWQRNIWKRLTILERRINIIRGKVKYESL